MPAAADRVRLRLEGPQMETYQVEIPVQGPAVDHAIASVPVGTVEVSAVAEESGRDVAVQTQVGQVLPSSSQRITLDFGSQASSRVSDPLVFQIPLDGTEVVAERLEVAVPLRGPAWEDFVASAEPGPVDFELRTLRIRLFERTPTVDSLQELWDGPLQVWAIDPSGTPSIRVGAAAPAEDALQVSVILNEGAARLEDLQDALTAGTAELVLDGPTDLDPPFTATVEVTAVFSARAE